MADPQMPPEVRAFMEKARADGYSDDEIRDYLKDRQAKQAEAESKLVNPNPLKAGLEGAWGALKGFGEGMVESPGNLVKGVVRLATHPIESVKETIEGVKRLPHAVEMAGGDPEGWGRGVGNITGQTMLTAAAPQAIPAAVRGAGAAATKVASVAAENPALAGGVLGYMHSGHLGAAEGALAGHMLGEVPGKGMIGRALRMGGRAREAAPAAAPQPTPFPSPKPEVPTAAQMRLGDVMRGEARSELQQSMAPPKTAPITGEEVVSMSRVPPERGLPPYKPPIVTEPPPDTSGMTVSRAAKTDLPVRDPKSGRMKRVYTSESAGETGAQSAPPKPAGFDAQVKDLTTQGFGSEQIADKLKFYDELKGLDSRTQRINRVREARGGESGQVPARARQAIDEAIEKLKTPDQQRAYLLRAPNAAVFNYVKNKLGL